MGPKIGPRGSPNGPKWLQNGPAWAPKLRFSPILDIFENASKKKQALLKECHPFMTPFGCPRAPTGSPTASKMEPKWAPNSILFCIRFHTVFSIVFGRRFCRFAGCWTFDLTAIYIVFVGSGIFRKVWKSSETGHPK